MQGVLSSLILEYFGQWGGGTNTKGIDIAVNGTTMTKQYEISFNAVKKGVKISMHLDNIHKISIKYLLCLIARQAAECLHNERKDFLLLKSPNAYISKPRVRWVQNRPIRILYFAAKPIREQKLVSTSPRIDNVNSKLIRTVGQNMKKDATFPHLALAKQKISQSS